MKQQTFTITLSPLQAKGKEKPKKKPRVSPTHKGKVLSIIALTGMTIGTTACSSGSVLSWQGGDYFSMSGTPEGIAAYDEYMNGTITNSKLEGEEMVTSPYWTVKREKTKADMYRKQLEKMNRGRK
jgi:hypothetical protein